MFEAIVLAWALIDGDTMRVSARVWPGVVVEERVRFLGVDTPELRGSPPCERLLAREATEWVRQRMSLAGFIELKANARDDFGRVLAVVLVDGVSLNQLMLDARIARAYGQKGAWC